MPSLPVVSSREAGKAFTKLGFMYHHRRGSHMINYHHDGRHLSTHDHRELDRGLPRKLIRSADITVDEFMGLLQDP
jgi:predicted RNA binding protein YcfA (HicA-like mRNA interferase family)